MRTGAWLFRVTAAILMIFGGWSQSFNNAQDREEILPTILPARTVFDMFPYNLHCPEIEDISPGPEWNTISIGKTTLDELLLALKSIGDYQSIVSEKDPESWVFVHQPLDYTVPNWIDVCVHDNVVMAMSFEVVLPYNLSTLLMLYGEPDTIVDTPESFTKLFFWFEQGLIAGVVSVEGDSFGMVSNMILMPYQTSKDYPQHWPLSVIPEHLKKNVLNPFDFEQLLVSAVAQPSPTATSTILPRLTMTPTAHR